MSVFDHSPLYYLKELIGIFLFVLGRLQKGSVSSAEV